MTQNNEKRLHKAWDSYTVGIKERKNRVIILPFHLVTEFNTPLIKTVEIVINILREQSLLNNFVILYLYF